MPVKEHLLGAPWTRLVNEGYLADLTGQGFYKVTDEGKEYLDQQEIPA
jgi:predicted transcriptional regulator